MKNLISRLIRGLLKHCVLLWLLLNCYFKYYAFPKIFWICRKLSGHVPYYTSTRPQTAALFRSFEQYAGESEEESEEKADEESIDLEDFSIRIYNLPKKLDLSMIKDTKFPHAIETEEEK